MTKQPDIVLSGRFEGSYERVCLLYEYKIRDDVAIFKYRYNDWNTETWDGYFLLSKGTVYFNRDYPAINKHDYVEYSHRDHAYSNKEIREAIESYLVEKTLLETHE